jgi:hypothetical protein
MKGITDVQFRIRQMDDFGIDMQVLSLTTPTPDSLNVCPVTPEDNQGRE